MKKWTICLLAMLLTAASCQKPYETKIELGVNHEEILLPSFEEGHCFITVYSNSSWTIGMDGAVDWITLGQNAGEGIEYVRLDYGENLTGDSRSATVIVRGSGKECRIVVTQPKEI